MKYTVGMVHLHSKIPELILQEIFSAFIIFNFTQAAAWDVDTAWGRSRYNRRFNFSDAVYLCCQVLRGWFLDFPPFLKPKLLPCRETQEITGMFVNTLPVMLPVEGTTTDYLAYVSAAPSLCAGRILP